MMVQGVTVDDLIACFIERFHGRGAFLVIHKESQDTAGYIKILQELEDQLMMRVPNMIEMNSDFILVGTYVKEAKEFLKENPRSKRHIRIDLYVDGVLYECN